MTQTDCTPVIIGQSDERGRRLVRCKTCGAEWRTRYSEPAMIHRKCAAPRPQPRLNAPLAPRGGPGTELAALFAELGITERRGCNCKGIAAAMDREGVAGCRRKREHFLSLLNENANKYSWWEKLKAGSAAVLSGAPLYLGGLYDVAVRRAAAKAPMLQFFTSAQRTSDTLSLIPQLPPDLAAVCGIARSGLAPATELAMALHLPLFILSEQHGIIDPGCGFRLKGQDRLGAGPILIVDDSLGSGRSLRRALPAATKHWPERKLLTAVIYRNMLSKVACDFWARELNEFHLFEWNLFNSPFFTGALAYDFDGVLCRDGDSAAPLYLPRREEIPLIVTGRHESVRKETEAWLAKWRIRVRKMVMWPGGDLLADHDGVLAVSRYKAKHYAAAAETMLFIESDPLQALEIAELTGKLVLCPIAGRVY